MKIRTFPDFGLLIMGFLRQGISVYVDRAAGNTNHAEAGPGCLYPGLAKLNYSVLVARGQAIFYVQSGDCSGVSVLGYNSSPFLICGSQFG